MARKRITDFDSQPVINLMGRVPGLQGFGDQYSAWMRRACQDAFERKVHMVKDAKWVLGPQDYCFQSSVRNWVWVRSFTVDFGKGRFEIWRWRLFVSKRGHSLEFEDRDKDPWGSDIVVAGQQGLDHFIKTWAEAAGWEDPP